MNEVVVIALLAQENVLPETGLVGRIVGGVTVAGLLGLIVWWLLYVHLPNQDRKDAEKEKAQTERLKYLFERHREALELERAASERRHSEFVKEIRDGQLAILAMLRQLVDRGAS